MIDSSSYFSANFGFEALLTPSLTRLLFTERDSKKLPELVKKHSGFEKKLKEPKDYAVRITDLDGTIYWGRDEMLEIWSHLYLSESTEMVVIGAIDKFPPLAKGLKLIVLVDSQGKVYFYENEVLHHREGLCST